MSKTHVIDGVTYVEVEREAKVGEKVVVKEAEIFGGAYKNGDILTVKDVVVETFEKYQGIYVDEHEFFIHHREYDVLSEVIEEQVESTPDIDDLLANLARRVSSLEQQLRDTQGNVEKLAEELATVKHQSASKEVEVVTFEKFLDSIADKVAERLVGQR